MPSEYAVLSVRDVQPGDAKRIDTFRGLVIAGAAVAGVMFLVQFLIHDLELWGWVVFGWWVAWRGVTSLRAAGKGKMHEARQKLLIPAILSLLTLSFLPGLLYLTAYFYSASLENAPVLRLDRTP